MDEKVVDTESIRKYYESLKVDNFSRGYYLNPDDEFTLDLVESLLVNEKRYGYPACPCRLAKGIREKDLDIICPCDFRDQDLTDYGTCYCALYVSKKIRNGEKGIGPIPDRRKDNGARSKMENEKCEKMKLNLPVLRCKVCGYLCAREEAPETCPICGADKDRFEQFI
ncbi:MAG: ferredoxin-thioredoxin reductase catalytic domain-containing protein [bacterium]